ALAAPPALSILPVLFGPADLRSHRSGWTRLTRLQQECGLSVHRDRDRVVVTADRGSSYCTERPAWASRGNVKVQPEHASASIDLEWRLQIGPALCKKRA